MPKLENAKHDEFARLLAQGLKQGDAYIKAGYKENKGAASRLARSPVILDRVEEYKTEITEKIKTAMSIPNEENWQNLADMGLTMEWVANQYKIIYEESLHAGSFSAANTAVQNIQKLVEMENRGNEEDDAKNDSKLSVNETLSLLQGLRGVMDASEKEPVPELMDITPEEDQ